MTTQAIQHMHQLASALEAESENLRTELTDFTSGGTILDVRRADGRLFVMAYGPSFGFGVDEVHERDGWQTRYDYTTEEFDSAAARLRELVRGGSVFASSIELNLVVIYSRDIATSKSFYERLGLQFQLERHGTGPQHYAATLDGTVFEIYPCSNDKQHGSFRIGFQVVSVQQTVDELRIHGSRIISEPKSSPWGTRAVVEDPDGFHVELVERCTSRNAT